MFGEEVIVVLATWMRDEGQQRPAGREPAALVPAGVRDERHLNVTSDRDG